MSNWKLIIDTYNALPASDRTSAKVHSQLLKQEHSVSMVQVREVLSATVLSNMLTKEDVLVTARTLNTLHNIRSDGFGSTEPSSTDEDFAFGLTQPLGSIVGPEASDLTQAVMLLAADYREFVELMGQLDYIEQMHELRSISDEGIPS